MKIFILEAAKRQELYEENLSGPIIHSLLNTMGFDNKFRFTVTLELFKRGVFEAAGDRFDVLHVCCHGNHQGVGLGDDDFITWEEFSAIFQESRFSPEMLIMSTCFGAEWEIANAFSNKEFGPKLIFGSTSKVCGDDLFVAWAILYRRLFKDLPGPQRMIAVNHINTVVDVAGNRFLLYYWNGSRYVQFPEEA